MSLRQLGYQLIWNARTRQQAENQFLLNSRKVSKVTQNGSFDPAKPL